MNVTFKPSAWEQYADWQKTDKTILTKINALILECQRHPFEGTGKPEPLRGIMRDICRAGSRANTGWFTGSTMKG